MQLMLFSIALYAGYFQGIDEKLKSIFHVISFALTTPVLFYSGWPIIKGSLRGIKNLTFNMDVLIATGAVSAYGYSVFQMLTGGEVYFDTAAMIITLILLGRYIEAGARRRASETIIRLMQLGPGEARKLITLPDSIGQGHPINDEFALKQSFPLVGNRSSETILKRDDSGQAGMTSNTSCSTFFESIKDAVRQMTPVSSLKPGDYIEVIPGEKIPVDGVLVDGSSETDESMLTGESKPSAKTIGSEVFGGTLNLYGSFVFRVSKIAKETVLAQIIQAVEDAQARRAPVQSAADRVVGYFVPAVLFIALMTFLGWLYRGAPMSSAVMNAVSVMVIACPCALGLATPLAILISTSYGASRGILIKGGDVIEKTASIDFVVLDKTGTVTEGRPALIRSFGVGIPESEALRLAASLEQKSEHSLGKAIADAARGLAPYEVLDFSAIPGSGVKGVIRGKAALIGSRECIEAGGMRASLDAELDSGQRDELSHSAESGATVVFLSYDSHLRGAFVVSDKTRKEAAEAVVMLRKAGLGVSLVTGDSVRTADAVATATGIDVVKAHVSPLQKTEEIEQLEKQGHHVLMAGDGINDAPALVRATVGVAMGRATDITLESSDIVVMRPDLRLIPDAVALAKKTFGVIRQNIFWAFFYNIVVIPLAVIGVLHPIVAALAMAFSSLTVVGNSLRARLP
jgi:Cu2+-exporting ATPase